jgi:arylsulfatase A-like enzyme
MNQRPNIILIITEQHRGDCLSIEGHPVLQTPQMDNIAGRGVRFTRAYTSCPTCIAARRSILSGQFPVTHGMVGYRDGVEWVHAPVTLPAALAAAGYHTFHVGRSMHQTPARKRYGFDHMVIHEDYNEWLEEKAPGRGGFFGSGIRNNDHTAYPWPLEDYLHSTNWTIERGLDMLAKRDPSRPYFLNLSFLAAHPPLQPPKPYFERYLRTGVPQPHIGDWAVPPPNRGLGRDNGSTSIQLEGEALLSARAGYYGLINHLDDQLRRILYPARSPADLENTIVMLVSDHGEMLGDHFRWHKIMPYEGSARIPFLLQAPSRFSIEPGTVISELVCLEDVMPTLLDMAGVPIPETVEGRSLLPLMQGRGGRVREQLHIEHASSYHCLTDGREKYIWLVRDGREQFFDLADDPHELHDQARVPARQERLAFWRAAMVRELAGRPEGFSDGRTLIPGRPYPPVLPHALPAPMNEAR